MLTAEQLAVAREQLSRLLTLIENGDFHAGPIERAHLVGTRDTLAAVLRPDDPQEVHQ